MKMMNIRITFKDEAELKRLISTLEVNYKILSISRKYANTRSGKVDEFRVYIKVKI